MKKIVTIFFLTLVVIIGLSSVPTNTYAAESSFTLTSVSTIATYKDAKISWYATTPLMALVEYGTSTKYGQSTLFGSFYVTSNAELVGGLMSETIYHYRLIFKDRDGNISTSGDGIFSTPPRPQENGDEFHGELINIPPRSGVQIYPTPIKTASPPGSPALPGSPDFPENSNSPASGGILNTPSAGTGSGFIPKLDYSGFVKCDGVVTKGEEGRQVRCDFVALMDTIVKLINWLFSISTAIAVALFAWSGILYMTGKSANISKAKSVFTSVGIGFIIMIVAWLAVYTAVKWIVDPNFGATSLIEEKK
jgi:hypothetical protein